MKRTPRETEQQYAELQAENFDGLAERSLDKKNIKQYKNKAKQRKSIVNNVDSDTMKARDNAIRNMSNGLRTSPHHMLTDEEIESVKRDAKEINVPEDVLLFEQGFRTSFSDENKMIHYYLGWNWRDEFRASYRTAVGVPYLTDEERRRLMLGVLTEQWKPV